MSNCRKCTLWQGCHGKFNCSFSKGAHIEAGFKSYLIRQCPFITDGDRTTRTNRGYEVIGSYLSRAWDIQILKDGFPIIGFSVVSPSFRTRDGKPFLDIRKQRVKELLKIANNVGMEPYWGYPHRKYGGKGELPISIGGSYCYIPMGTEDIPRSTVPCDCGEIITADFLKGAGIICTPEIEKAYQARLKSYTPWY